MTDTNTTRWADVASTPEHIAELRRRIEAAEAREAGHRAEQLDEGTFGLLDIEPAPIAPERIRKTPLQVYTGDTRDRQLFADNHLVRSWGRVWIDRKPRQWFDDEPWILDNGAYRCFRKGEAWRPDLFLRRLRKAVEVPGCQAVVLPDVVGDAEATIAMATEWLERLHGEFGDLPYYFVTQDGMRADDPRIEALLDDERIAGIFLGGSDEHKWDCFSWAEEAHRRGKRFHFGRTSSTKLLALAMACTADSCDSAFWLIKRSARIDGVEAMERQGVSSQVDPVDWAAEQAVVDAVIAKQQKAPDQGDTQAEGGASCTKQLEADKARGCAGPKVANPPHVSSERTHADEHNVRRRSQAHPHRGSGLVTVRARQGPRCRGPGHYHALGEGPIAGPRPRWGRPAHL